MTNDITRLLEAHRDGEEDALGELFQLVYAELRQLARSQRRRLRGHQTLNTTGLVHEAYMKLTLHAGVAGRDRGHFFAVAAQAMRHILVDYARGRGRAKRGGDQIRVDLEPDQLALDGQAETILAVNEALQKLRELDPRLATITECRFFAGMTEQETAEAVGISVSTVQRSWQAVRSYLGAELTLGAPPSP